MRKILFSLCFALTLFGADDPWAKVKELKTGTELRVYKKGSAQPLEVKLGDLTDENLVVIDKNKETAIARELIDRIDYRPTGKPRVTKESKTESKDFDPKQGGPTSSSSGGLSIGSKPGFETAYRRPTGAPAKK